jgi:hypothetical protein
MSQGNDIKAAERGGAFARAGGAYSVDFQYRPA